MSLDIVLTPVVKITHLFGQKAEDESDSSCYSNFSGFIMSEAVKQLFIPRLTCSSYFCSVKVTSTKRSAHLSKPEKENENVSFHAFEDALLLSAF